MRTLYFVFTILIAVLTLGLGQGQSWSSANDRRYGIDLNSDGIISMEEWQSNQRTFMESDLNGDGFLSGGELGSGMIRPISQAIGEDYILQFQSTTHTVETPVR